MPKKALIAMLNSKYIHSSLAPWCLFASAKEKCQSDIELKVTEGTINEDIDKFAENIISQKPFAVSFSCYIWNIEKTLYACKKIKQALPHTKIILGGPEVSFNSEDMLKNYSFIDFVLCGEGEDSYPLLLNSIFNNTENEIPGLTLRKGDEIISYAERVPNEKTLVSPYCKEYFESLKNKIAYIEASRGCPFSCSFCLSGSCNKVRFLPLENVKAQMKQLCAHGAKTIKFIDRTFNCNKKRAIDILLYIKENYYKEFPSGVCFHFEIAADLLDEELLSVVKAMPDGSVQFEIGIQSFNTETLKLINRKTNLSKVTENTKKLLSFGNCHIHIDLIAGLPKEDYNSFIKGFNEAYSIKADMLQLGFLKVLHGSEIERQQKEYDIKYSHVAPYEVISTSHITNEELQLLHIAENELERLYNSHRFENTLDYVLSESGLSPYDLFLSFGLYLKEKSTVSSIPLNDYIGFVFSYFCTLKNINKDKLRDVMLKDRISTNNSNIIPPCLKKEDPYLAFIKAKLKKQLSVKGNFSVGILYTENKIIYCTYKEKSAKNNIYKTETLPLNYFEQEKTDRDC